jgi:hypothetical protein
LPKGCGVHGEVNHKLLGPENQQSGECGAIEDPLNQAMMT